MHNFYNKLHKKEESFKDFVEFIDYMIDTSQYIHNEEYDAIRNDFNHHFIKIPIYTRHVFQKVRHDMVSKIGSVAVTTKHLSELVDDFTNMK